MQIEKALINKKHNWKSTDGNVFEDMLEVDPPEL